MSNGRSGRARLPLQHGRANRPGEPTARADVVRRSRLGGDDPVALSAAFGKANKKRADQIEGILETLRGLGLL